MVNVTVNRNTSTLILNAFLGALGASKVLEKATLSGGAMSDREVAEWRS